MNRQKQAEELLTKYNQNEVLEALNKLDKTEKEELIEQILTINFEEMERLFNSTKSEKRVLNEEITPIDYIDKDKLSKDEFEKYVSIGDEIIKNGELAVVTMAGGLGTRLGFDGPKGTYQLENGKYIFEILTENLKLANKLYGIYPYWYIMTSRENNKQTTEFLSKHNFFGYEKEKIKFFCQGSLPMLTKEGKMVIENNKIKTGSNGNGGVYTSMEKEEIIKDMRQKGIKWVYICGVDNIMVKPIDPLFIGLTISKNMNVASKSIAKNYPEEKVGAFCKKNGKPSIVEYIELPENMRTERDKNGELIYGESNIVSHLLKLDSIEKIAEKKLDYHLDFKKGLYKFEAFVFDGFKFETDMLVMRVNRDEEFAPIKNKDGIDSPKTALEIYEKNKCRN